jgi:thioesterase superfamily protein 4
MMDVVTPRIASIPWAAALINDPDWIGVDSFSRQPKASGEDSFLAETLKTDRTIRNYLAFRPVKEAEGEIPLPEIRIIVDIGTGVNGHPEIAHGGFSALLLDEACGAAINMHRDIRMEQMQKRGQTFDYFHYFTACSS